MTMENKKQNTENLMRNIKIEKIILGVSGTGETIEKGYKLLEFLTGRKPCRRKSTKRIPTWGVRPGLDIGVIVTIRKNFENLLKKLLAAEDNKLRRKQIVDSHFSFGVKEYLEIPGVEYQREIGIMGLDVTVVFVRSGRRVKLRKMKKGKFSKRQAVKKEEIIKFMEDKFGTEFVGK